MVDRELAAKLQRRLNSIGQIDNEDNPSTVVQPNLQSSPPKPNQVPYVNPFESVDESIDMDAVIGMALERKPYSQIKNVITVDLKQIAPVSDRVPEAVKKPLPESSVSEESQAADYNVQSRCAPLVPIVHHRDVIHKSSQPLIKNLFKERNELEEKLAKQRKPKNIKPDMNGKLNDLPKTGNTNDSSAINPTFNSKIPPETPRKPSADQVRLMTQKQVFLIKSHSLDDGNELASKLAYRNKIIEGEEEGRNFIRHPNIYSEFEEFSRKQIKYFIDAFKKFDEDRDSFIDFNELKRMMEKLGEAQTHIALKQILKLVDEDGDGKVNLREFLLIFRYARTNQLTCSKVFNELAASVDVTKEGVQAATNFFESKIEELTKGNKFEEEVRAERDEKKKIEEEKKERRQQFLANKSVFLT